MMFLFCKEVLVETKRSSKCLEDYACLVSYLSSNEKCENFFNSSLINTISNASANNTVTKHLLCYKFNEFEDILFTKVPVFYATYTLINEIHLFIFKKAFKLAIDHTRKDLSTLIVIVTFFNGAMFLSWMIFQFLEVKWVSIDLFKFDFKVAYYELIAIALSSFSVILLGFRCANELYQHRDDDLSMVFYRNK